MPIIERLSAREILDSRGRPTVAGTCKFVGQQAYSASVPSGVSTGNAEAQELRDGDPTRYKGLGCKRAVSIVCKEVNEALAGDEFPDQADLDYRLIEVDGTPDKSRLGANSVLAVSLAYARSMAAMRGIPLWQYFADLIHVALHVLPRLTINLFSGGRHAGGQVAIQDVLVVPTSARSIDQSLAMTYDVYDAAAQFAWKRFGMRLLRADEGGLAPPFANSEEMIEAAVYAIESCGFKAGRDFTIALDIAASQFFCDGVYNLDGTRLYADALIQKIKCWVEQYPIVSVEDGLSQDDWGNWPHLKREIEQRSLVVGDDLLCTNSTRIRRAIEVDAANTLLLKVNQVGTLTEAADACKLARSAGWLVTVSARSGETEDNWAADLAVGWGGDQFKNGSITQSERLSKYNRLLQIESETRLPITNWPNRVQK